jgi:hypothetical protein
MSKKLYALSLGATDGIKHETMPGAAIAHSKEEAIGIGIEEVKKLLKQKYGWSNYHCDAVEISQNMIDRIKGD